MKFRETKLPGAFVIEPKKIEDERGFFARAWSQTEFEERGLNPRVVQSNLSYSRKKGTLRGLHYQITPYEEARLVRCIRGAILDVMIDLRLDSPTYMQWIGVELTAANRKMLYAPEGFAHGFQTLEDDSEAFYQVSAFYCPEAERGVRWDDPTFGIVWPVAVSCVSEKDRRWPVPFSRELPGGSRVEVKHRIVREPSASESRSKREKHREV